MAEDRGAERTREEAHREGRKREHRADVGALFRKEQLVEHERRDHPVDEEVVPFDRRADSRRDNSANRVPSMLFVRTLHQPFFAANRVAGLR
jgi:hypothetical protein